LGEEQRAQLKTFEWFSAVENGMIVFEDTEYLEQN
jgi:hypothetical protein